MLLSTIIVNAFLEKTVQLQTECEHYVITPGPYLTHHARHRTNGLARPHTLLEWPLFRLPRRHMNYVQFAYYLVVFLLFLPLLFVYLSAIITAFRCFSQRPGHRKCT